MPKFTADASPALLKLLWMGDDDQDHDSFQLLGRMVVLYASSQNRGQFIHGLLDVDSATHEGEAAATFLARNHLRRRGHEGNC